MTKSKLYRNGVYVRDLNEDEDFVAKDGESIHVAWVVDGMPDFNGDTALHRPGQMTLADSDRRRREQMGVDQKQRLSDAWKNPPALDASLTPSKPAIIAVGTRDAVEDAYERRNKALEGAWR